jgi:hypothetical protein
MTTRKKKLFKVAGKLLCLKHKYDSEREAKRVLKAARRVGLKAHYKCPICGSWHLTSKRDRKRK